LTGSTISKRDKRKGVSGDASHVVQPTQLRTYAFDNILPPPSSNEDLYKEAAATVVTAVSKYNQDGTGEV